MKASINFVLRLDPICELSIDLNTDPHQLALLQPCGLDDLIGDSQLTALLQPGVELRRAPLHEPQPDVVHRPGLQPEPPPDLHGHRQPVPLAPYNAGRSLSLGPQNNARRLH